LTYQKPSEAQLVAQLQAGDKKAFEYLYDSYSAALLGIAMRVLNSNQPLAEDAIQESFVKIWKNINNYDTHKGTIFTWMLNIVRNTSIDKLRSLNAKPIQNSLSDVSVIDVKSNLELNTDAIGLQEIIQKLKPEYQEIINLAYFKGYTQEEMAVMLNTPLGTIKTRNRSALQQLRNIFKA
jgi:RNA polymerase sigma-70 factor (ECF subfamily)